MSKSLLSLLLAFHFKICFFFMQIHLVIHEINMLCSFLLSLFIQWTPPPTPRNLSTLNTFYQLTDIRFLHVWMHLSWTVSKTSCIKRVETEEELVRFYSIWILTRRAKEKHAPKAYCQQNHENHKIPYMILRILDMQCNIWSTQCLRTIIWTKTLVLTHVR